MKKYVITIIVIVGIILLLFGSYSIYSNNNSQDSVDTLKSKVDNEIAYLNYTIISIMNKFNNITYANYKIVEEKVPLEDQNQSSSSSSQGQEQSGESNRGESQSNSTSTTNININYSSILVNPDKTIDWDYIKKEIEKMYGTWTTVLMDLNALNVNKDNLLKYNSNLDDITQALEKKDKKASLKGLADLYSLLVSYTKDYSNDDKIINIYDTKSNVLYAYALVEYDDKWDDMKNYIKQAQNAYNNIMNSQLQNGNKITNINRAYILVNEIEKTIDKKDKNIFYINYKNLMQELEIIEL